MVRDMCRLENHENSKKHKEAVKAAGKKSGKDKRRAKDDDAAEVEELASDEPEDECASILCSCVHFVLFLRCCRELSAAANSKARGKKDKRKDRKKAALAELTRQVSGEAGLVRDNDDD